VGFCEVRFTRSYPAPPAEVWAALTEPESIGRWLAQPVEIDLSPGGAYELRGLPARVRSVEPERVLELDWEPAGEDPSVVRFELTPHEDGTQLVLDHRRINAVIGMAYMERWVTSLERLDGVIVSAGAAR
jgi:uncharacterized protein YndB with AHSA1/START domain